MSKQIKTCGVCGAKIVEYHHSLSKLLVNSLVKFWQEVGRESVSLKDTRLSFSERTNFQKLRYWGLVEKGTFTTTIGTWRVTGIGESFLKNWHMTGERVVTFRGKFIRYEGKLIQIKDVTGYEYDHRKDYARIATPIENKDKQLSLV